MISESKLEAVRLSNVSFRYRRSMPVVVDDVSFSIAAGTTTGIVGESGSGKSTLARLIVGETRATSGSVEVFGNDWLHMKRTHALRRGVQMIFQDPFGALNPFFSPLQAVAEAAGVTQGLRRQDAFEVARSLLQEVGLAGAMIDRAPGALSGGQRQRVVIARALACEPRVLVADEATSALDVSVQAQILNLLMRLQAERGLTVVLISHDISVVDHMTDDVLVVHRGHIVEQGTTSVVLHSPREDYTRKLVGAFDEASAR